MRNQTVLISGASIAGPALASWLTRYGFTVTVVERAESVRPGGQAVDFKGQTHLTVLERMGVLDEIREHETGRTDLAYIDGQGRERARLTGEFLGGDVEILRGDLAQILYRQTEGKCEYLFGDSITALVDSASGVYVEFEHAPARTFDLVIGCDGIHSRVRRLAFGPEENYVRHLGYYYCVAGAPGWGNDPSRKERNVGLAFHAPGRLAVTGGSKAAQMFMFAAPELDYDRHDVESQRRIVLDRFAGMGGGVEQMLTELPGLDDFYLDSISQARLDGNYTSGRVALVGDSAYGNTLGGFGTGMAVVGAYVLAGELAAANGDHTVAYERYDEIMRRYAKIAGNTNAGRFLAPKTKLGIRFRNWFVGSRAFGLMLKFSDDAANNIELKDYPELVVGQ
ncbi:FAD-dependent monooxygenase [Nocardia pseudobrasiliensis]|uniref:2-polyprenyl-6-methoxyphenol hydroxylase-like FAD-dependent oxidoreductase n=1 Tax=Nocardia pseudobrasiliensis TaxID=45979 RepID=A0A370HM02_9NOCA|nr:FAD-dependent monooxygenase [Nocardia pseudobrasiliensis]RDI59071.1 2-polyprenyl-6-methoxyphenol hydroxylase-like FAD-dependent oxidoreductase [Nocardia pseudobrasiliensis]